jgi:hypothetical protein
MLKLLGVTRRGAWGFLDTPLPTSITLTALISPYANHLNHYCSVHDCHHLG